MPMLQRRFDWRESKYVQCFEEQDFLFRRVESLRVGMWCIVRKGGRPRACILLDLMRWIYAYMDFLDWPHMDMVR